MESSKLKEECGKRELSDLGSADSEYDEERIDRRRYWGHLRLQKGWGQV